MATVRCHNTLHKSHNELFAFPSAEVTGTRRALAGRGHRGGAGPLAWATGLMVSKWPCFCTLCFSTSKEMPDEDTEDFSGPSQHTRKLAMGLGSPV